MTYKRFIVLTLHFLVQVLSSKKYLVQTNCRSTSSSCRTFTDYANDADTFFTSDSSFHFMKGAYHLNVTLLITNVVNLSFDGDESDIILCDGCSIICNKSSNIFWSSLNIIFNETNKLMNSSALCFENAEVVTFSNISISRKSYDGLNFFSRAILIMDSSIVFESCKFENGHHSSGGALYIEDSNVTFGGHNDFLNNTANNTAGAIYGLRSQIQFNDSGTFMRNIAGIDCRHNSDGTAIHVEFSNISLCGYFKFSYNHIIKDEWYQDGGGTIAVSYSLLTLKGKGAFFFNNNSNHYGGAIWLNNSVCLISGHAVFASNKAFVDGGALGAIHSSLIIKNFNWYNNSEYTNSECFSKSYSQGIIFCNNSAEVCGGAVNLEGSNMTLSGFVVFMANKAWCGGGISLYYTSEITKLSPNFVIFDEPLNLLFHSNVAKRSGGALHIYDSYLDCRKLTNYSIFNCFFTVNDSINLVNLNFTDNKASDRSTSIYGGAIQYCQVNVKNKISYGYQVLQNLTKTTTDIKNEYTNDGTYKICLCNGSTDNITVQRGQVFNISVTVLGEFDFPINQSVAFTQEYFYPQITSSEVTGQSYNYAVRNGCRNLGFHILSRYQRVYLRLHPPRCYNHPASITVTIHLVCLPEYVPSDVCKCRDIFFKVTGHKDLCEISTGLIKCPQHDWMKPILYENLSYQGFMWSPNCPAHLCRSDNKNKMLNFSNYNDSLCLQHRTAMLCGACLENYSLTLSTLKCSKCNSNNYLSLLLVFTLAGVALIAFFLLLQITIADGTINGLIFYANIINIVKDLVFPQDKLPSNPLTLFLPWLNLDLGIEICFYTGLNYYSYTWLQFIFPFYLWFLVGLIILACKYSSRAMKLFGSNPVAVLATVVLMSYSKLLHTSQEILSYVTVYYSNGTQEKRWKMDPNLHYFQGEHIPLAMFGIFIVTLFLIPYLVLISFGYYLQRYSNKRGLRWLVKIKPILDAYYAPFCKNARYWVGFQLFVRTSLSITYSALSNTERTTILVIISSILYGMALIPWLQQIYQTKLVNVLEGSLITNIIVLFIAMYHFLTPGYEYQQLIVFYTSLCVAFVEFLAVLFFHIWHHLNLKWLYMKYGKSFLIRWADDSSNSSKIVSEKSLHKHGGNVSTTAVFDIREPLLDDSITEL